MNNKKILEKLRSINIINMWDLTSFGMPMICYSTNNGSRMDMGRPIGWMLSLKGKNFKNSPMMHNGGKCFDTHFRQGTLKERRDAGLKEALEYIKKLFPDVVMVKGPWPYTYVNKEDYDKALEKIKDLK